MAYSYSKKHSPCAPHLFLPLDGVDPRIYLDKQSSSLALTLVQKLHTSWLLTGDSLHYDIPRYSYPSKLDVSARESLLTYVFPYVDMPMSIRYTV